MICTSCGNPVESFNRFCPKCGTPVQPQSSPQYGSPPPYSSPQQTPMMSGPVAQPAKKSGCGKIILIVAVIMLILGGGLAVAIYFGYQYAEKTLKSSEAYNVALNALKANEEVKDQLGEVTGSGFPLGAYSQNADGSGNAAFVMSVQGTKDSGQYEVNLVRSNSVWRLTKGVLQTKSGQRINITDQSSDAEDPNLNTNTDPLINTDQAGTRGRTVSGGVLNGKAINLPKPNYPPIARQARASGTVVVQVVVDEDGDVVSARAVSGHPLLRAAAEAAAREAKFSPTKVNGKPVKVSGVIRYEFKPE